MRVKLCRWRKFACVHACLCLRGRPFYILLLLGQPPSLFSTILLSFHWKLKIRNSVTTTEIPCLIQQVQMIFFTHYYLKKGKRIPSNWPQRYYLVSQITQQNKLFMGKMFLAKGMLEHLRSAICFRRFDFLLNDSEPNINFIHVSQNVTYPITREEKFSTDFHVNASMLEYSGLRFTNVRSIISSPLFPKLTL